MDEDPEDGFNTEENYYTFLNIPKTVSWKGKNVNEKRKNIIKNHSHLNSYTKLQKFITSIYKYIARIEIVTNVMKYHLSIIS